MTRLRVEVDLELPATFGYYITDPSGAYHRAPSPLALNSSFIEIEMTLDGSYQVYFFNGLAPGATSPYALRILKNDRIVTQKSGTMSEHDNLAARLCSGVAGCEETGWVNDFSGCANIPPDGNWSCSSYVREDLVFDYPDDRLPAPVFDLTASASELERHVLMGAYRPPSVPASDPVYAYWSTRQTEDGKLRVTVTGNDAQGAPLNGQTIYFRIVDPHEQRPPLISPPHGTATDYYVTNAHENDNRGTEGAASLSATAVPMVNGTATVDLIVGSGVAGGDNYQIEASYNDAFYCRSGCARSGVITAWKRAYIEQKKMFRKGAYLSANVDPSSTTVRVQDVAKLMGLKGNNNYAVLIHAPAIVSGRAEDQTFYQTPPLKIVSVSPDQQGQTTGPGTVAVASPVGNWFYEPEDPTIAYSADAIGLVSDDSALFVPNSGYLTGFYQSAFLDARVLPDAHSSVRYFPYNETLDQEGDQKFLASKWFEHRSEPGCYPDYDSVALPNHRFVVGAAWNKVRTSTGYSRRPGAWSYLYLGFIESMKSITAANRLKFGGEATVHEVGHVLGNPHDYGVPWYSSPDRHCIMQDGPYWFDLQLKPLPQFYDGLMEFHHKSDSDSEYITIRKRVEPLPQY